MSKMSFHFDALILTHKSFDTDTFHLKAVACQFDLDFHKVILGSLLQRICVPHTIHLGLSTCNHNSSNMFSPQFPNFWAAQRKLEFASQHIYHQAAVVLIFGGQLYLFSIVIFLNVLHIIIIFARVEHYILICTLKQSTYVFPFQMDI